MGLDAIYVDEVFTDMPKSETVGDVLARLHDKQHSGDKDLFYTVWHIRNPRSPYNQVMERYWGERGL